MSISRVLQQTVFASGQRVGRAARGAHSTLFGYLEPSDPLEASKLLFRAGMFVGGLVTMRVANIFLPDKRSSTATASQLQNR